MRLTPVQFFLSLFLLEVVGAKRAFTLSLDGDLRVLHDQGETIFPLWSSRSTARRARRKSWPHLRLTEIPLDDLMLLMQRAIAEDVVIGIGDAMEDLGLFWIPADWLERALRAGIERRWRPEQLH
ncbi:MAG: DUF2750 domain-containing protein [Deltaproteobacteria bacterium]|nr:DUF2750 domain-containing protein [Deltaproteobacteria bacterium]